ncbi:MAG: hypothetical protein WBM99_16975 [Psychromonas sp.]
MADVIIIIGVLILIVGGIFFLIETFKESILWGIGCLIISPISFIFAILHWDVSKKPVLIQLTGLGVMFLGVFLGGNL